MRITMIGHASIFVESQDCNIIMDPVLFDPHCEDIEDICPKREVIHDKIPEFDVLVISHRHLDHFDIRSLASLPKNVDVFIPQDKLLKTCLCKLGYSNIYYLKDESEVKIGSTHLIATRSENRVPEYGMLFVDPSGVFWNQVDSDISLKTIQFVKSRYSQVDFLLASWQPMLESNYQNNRSLSFPYSSYNKELEKVGLIKPKAISPGANGFKFINGSSWLNQIVFPVTREQYCRDIQIVCPEVGKNVFALDPGDILDLQNGEFSYMPAKSQFVKKLKDDRDELYFSPVNLNNSLIDDNSNNYALDEMKTAIEEEVCFNLPQFIMENKDSLFIEHYRWQVIYQLEVVFPNRLFQWYFDFTQETIQAQPGRHPLANFYNTITASSLYGFIKGIKGWDHAHMGGYYRSFKKIYVPTTHGIVQPYKTQIKEPLDLRFPYQDIFEKVRHHEIEKWSSVNSNDTIPYQSKTMMMKIGNTLIRLAKTNSSKDSNETITTEISQLYNV
ncbi:MAG: MBL fold metallo-hydrolase [Xenococcaceae cyanobacterium]